MTFKWVPQPGSLKRRDDGGNDDQVYTVVLEKNAGPEIVTFQLAPGDDIKKYFQRGIEIWLSADGYRNAGYWQAFWATMYASVNAVSESTSSAFTAARVTMAKGAGVASEYAKGSYAPKKAAAARPKLPDCIRIHTLQASAPTQEGEERVTAALLAEPCFLVNSPAPFDLPAGSLRTGWLLR